MTNKINDGVVQFSGVKTAVILALEDSNSVARVRARAIFNTLRVIGAVFLGLAILAMLPIAMIALQSVTGEYCINYPEALTCN